MLCTGGFNLAPFLNYQDQLTSRTIRTSIIQVKHPKPAEGWYQCLSWQSFYYVLWFRLPISVSQKLLMRNPKHNMTMFNTCMRLPELMQKPQLNDPEKLSHWHNHIGVAPQQYHNVHRVLRVHTQQVLVIARNMNKPCTTQVLSAEIKPRYESS